VNDRIYVNNVSIGIYGEAVQQPGYRNAKLRTLLETIPHEAGAHSTESELRWTDPEGGRIQGRATVLVSNNPYRLDEAEIVGRPRLDEGLLGVVVLEGPVLGKPPR